MTRKGELRCCNCDGPCLGCWEPEPGQPTTNRPACERQDGDCCEGGPRTCLAAFRSARDAGIPTSVILGQTKLSDHFDAETIAANAGREVIDES